MTHVPCRLFTLAFVGLVVGTSGCSDDAEDAGPSGPPASKADTEKRCNELCTDTGFSASRVDALEHETNCICTGPGTVTAEACQKMCQAINKPTPSASKSSGATRLDSCQCS